MLKLSGLLRHVQPYATGFAHSESSVSIVIPLVNQCCSFNLYLNKATRGGVRGARLCLPHSQEELEQTAGASALLKPQFLFFLSNVCSNALLKTSG